MRQKSGLVKESVEKVVKDIHRATRRHFSAEDKIRIVLEGLRGKECIVELMAADRWQVAATPSDPGTIGFHLSALYSNLAKPSAKTDHTLTCDPDRQFST